MPRKIFKSKKRSVRSAKRPVKRRRRLAAEHLTSGSGSWSGGSGGISFMEGIALVEAGIKTVQWLSSQFPGMNGKRKPLKRISGLIKRGNRLIRRELAPANPAEIKGSPGLVIGTYKKLSMADKIKSIITPPTMFNAKWTFNMDCQSGTVTACSIPILTQQLAAPLYNQLFSNLLSDVGGVAIPPTVTSNPTFEDQYQVMINSYKSNYRFYNSSTNTLRCRLVWYKPKVDMDDQYLGFGANTTDPINMLMLASNAAAASVPIHSLAQSGLSFDTTSAGSNYNASYHHAGAAIDPTLGGTTFGTNTNTVAYLDATLVPGAPQVRKMFSSFWTTLKSEEFTLQPGNQYNTSVRMRNRVMKNGYQDTSVRHRKDATVIGVVYVIGQIVFNQSDLNQTISTGSSQLSVMREDTCSLRPMLTKRVTRVNLSNPYQRIDSADQAKINTESDTVDDVYVEDR